MRNGAPVHKLSLVGWPGILQNPERACAEVESALLFLPDVPRVSALIPFCNLSRVDFWFFVGAFCCLFFFLRLVTCLLTLVFAVTLLVSLSLAEGMAAAVAATPHVARSEFSRGLLTLAVFTPGMGCSAQRECDFWDAL